MSNLPLNSRPDVDFDKIAVLPIKMQYNEMVNAFEQVQRSRRTKYIPGYAIKQSNIQGLGLFATRDYQRNELIIEYSGEVIRRNLSSYREREYNRRGIGCYMFTIDEHLIVDATIKGAPSRYINHSCNPNCYAEILKVDKHKKVLIIAQRRIKAGEEFSYDYKFDREEEKIACNCAAYNCLGYMN